MIYSFSIKHYGGEDPLHRALWVLSSVMAHRTKPISAAVLETKWLFSQHSVLTCENGTHAEGQKGHS